MQIVLVHPEIPQNTGSIGRMCVCTGTRLHLIEPLGFSLDESRVKRAGMDYWKHVDLHVHADWDSFLAANSKARMIFASTRGTKPYFAHKFEADDCIVFGKESGGFPPDFYSRYAEQLITIPMNGQFVRSHNLATSAAIVLYEGIRQLQFPHFNPV